MIKTISLVVAVWATAFLGYAQVGTSEVLGTVRDASQSAVPKASVTLTSKETGIALKTATDSNGEYDFLNVKVGHYTLDVEVAGFAKSTADVNVDVEARQRADIALQVGVVSDSVTVAGAATSLDTDNSEHSQVIPTPAVAELPLNGRNYADLALLSTNAVKSPIAVSFSASGTPREGSFNVNGMRSTYNNFLLDGVDNNSYGTSNQGYSSQLVQPSPDAVSEFKVITGSFSAEYGRVGGAIVNAAMKSGTNQFHGAAWEFLRNTDLNATGFLFSPSVFVKPTLQRNQFGAAIGGPIVQNKLFFFGDYEGYRQLQRYLNFDSIPDATDRLGILPVAVTNPLTGITYPANTQIPIQQLNPFAYYALSNLPATNNAGCSAPASGALPISCRTNNDEALLLIRDYSDKYDAKLDEQINDHMSAFLRWSQRKDLQYYAPDLTGPSGGDGNGYIHTIDQDASLGYTWSVTPDSILEARLSFTHMVAGKEPPYVGGPSLASIFGGFQGLPTTSSLTGGLNTQTITGLTALGRQTSNPQFQNPSLWIPQLSYSKILNKHSLKFGYQYMNIRTEILDTNPLYGQDTYAGGFSKPSGGPSDATSYSIADFIFGLPNQVNQGSYTVVNLRQFVHSLYAQDDYRITPKLTLNLGLRWEFASPLYERDNNYSNFDPITDTMLIAHGGSLYNRALVHPNYGDFGPRVGMAYNFDSKTVIRSGYGISYTFFNRPGSAEEGINAPQALFGVITQSNPKSATFLTTLNSFTDNIASPAAFNPALSNVVYTPPDSPWPMIQNWMLSVERQLRGDTVLEVSYNGNQSTHLPIIADYNQAAPNPAGQTIAYTARVPIPTFGPITWLDPAGVNHYNGLAVRLEHHFTKGLYVLNAFTWGKGMGDSEQALEYYAGYVEANPQNIYDLAGEKGPSSFDVKLNNVTSIVYKLPFGKGRQFGSNMNPVLDAILGGWELNAINTAHTGTPLNVYYNATGANQISSLSNDYRGEPFPRPNVGGAAASQSRSQMLNTFFSGYTFTTPSPSQEFGDLGRNAFRAPGFWQWDNGIDKSFRVSEGVNLQFRSEFFNILNHTNFGIPDTKTSDAAFGTIRSTYPSRQIQFALKVTF
ncbi:MAG TPA: TonB-dependent receptor [Bryobacteraceae bacterium]|nr:TonB-dependent receptor [Bryobacteraceae bacterium]